MRIGILSTWGQKCGISTYSENLAAALAARDNQVFALRPNEAAVRPTPTIAGVKDCWSRDLSDGAAFVVATAGAWGLDVLHIQHEDGLLTSVHFVAFLAELRAALPKTPVVVTWHTVLPCRAPFYAACAALCHSVVHTVEGAAAFPASAYVVPHGTVAVDRTAALPAGLRGRIDPTQHKVILTFGFLNSGKNLPNSILAVSEVLGAAPEWRYVIAGAAGNYDHDVRYHLEYTGLLRGEVGPAYYLPGFMDDAAVAGLLASSSLVLLNTNSRCHSASGQLHLALSAGVPALCADRPIYNDARRAGQLVFENGDYLPSMDFLCKLKALVHNPVLRATLSRSGLAYARATAWPRLAKTYEKLYRSLQCP